MSTTAAGKLVNKPCFLEHNELKFIIMDAPSDQNLPLYIEVLKKKNVTNLCRCCEGTYSTSPLEDAGIKVLDIPFPDGDPPPDHVVTKWLDLVQSVLVDRPQDGSAIAVHCVAGLGRAPIMVAIALVEFGGLAPLDAVEFIRKKRRGAINARQLQYIEHYRPRTRAGGCCTIL